MNNEKIVFYTTHCPRCLILEKRLQDKKIEYRTITDVEIMVSKEFSSVPQLEVDGKTMDFSQAMAWAKSL